MQTVKEWADKITKDDLLFNQWLIKQYIGEVTAVTRIKELLIKSQKDKIIKNILNSVVKDEAKHANWIKKLLIVRNIEIPVINKEEAEKKYWSVLKNKQFNFNEYCAYAHYAEDMRLKRIKHISNDTAFPKDIRNIFKLIYEDELFHARIFKEITDKTSLIKMKEIHKQGLDLLGLIA